MIYFTSDLHFGHDKEFIYKPRCFNSIEEHDSAIIKLWNETISEGDEVYILGDLMLGDNEYGIECLKQLNGCLYYIKGNHDTPRRLELYNEFINYCGEAYSFKYRKINFYASHYPTITYNPGEDRLNKATINLFGHTHQNSNFYNDTPFMYHVGLDSHSCIPVSIDEIIEEIKDKYRG